MKHRGTHRADDVSIGEGMDCVGCAWAASWRPNRWTLGENVDAFSHVLKAI